MRDLFIKALTKIAKCSTEEGVNADFGKIFDSIRNGDLQNIDSFHLNAYSVISATSEVLVIEKKNDKARYLRRVLLAAIEARLQGKKTYIACECTSEMFVVRDKFFSLFDELKEKGFIPAGAKLDVLERGLIEFPLWSHGNINLDMWRVRGISSNVKLFATPATLESHFQVAFMQRDFFNDSRNITPFMANAELTLDDPRYISEKMRTETADISQWFETDDMRREAFRNMQSLVSSGALHIPTIEDKKRMDIAIDLGMVPKL